jgi:hypothetical protein
LFSTTKDESGNCTVYNSCGATWSITVS